MKHSSIFSTKLLLAAVPLLLSAGCAMFSQTTHRRASSVVEYLYAKDSKHIDEPTVPVLSLPLKVGIAFVPEADQHTRGGAFISPSAAPFTEKQKIALMKEVSDNFRKYPFVKSIELIPTAYLMPKGGFANLDQLHSMFGVDVIALLSYDQAQFTDEDFRSITYWTVVGAYFIRGEKNDTKTMMDAVVYDISSRKLLFRAPGVSQIKGAATPVNLNEQLRRDSELGFRQAATNLVASLQEELASFKERVKESPQEFQIVSKPGYTGAGSFGAVELLLLAGMGTMFFCSRKAQRQ